MKIFSRSHLVSSSLPALAQCSRAHRHLEWGDEGSLEEAFQSLTEVQSWEVTSLTQLMAQKITDPIASPTISSRERRSAILKVQEAISRGATLSEARYQARIRLI